MKIELRALLLVSFVTLMAPIASGRSQTQKPSGKDETKALMDALHPPPKPARAPRGIVLLPGYRNLSSVDFEGNKTGEIVSETGLTVHYEGGFSQGFAADPTKRSSYRWFRNHVVQGNRVYVAMTKDGELRITFPWTDDLDQPLAMNFYAEVRSDAELADVLLMVMGCEVCHEP